MATTILEDIREDLAADATLTATVTGAIVLVSNTSTDKAPLNWTDTPAAYTTDSSTGVKKLKPSIVISPSTEAPVGPRGVGRVLVFRVNYYDAAGYTTIETARLRVRALLHDVWRKLDDGSNYRTRLLDTRDGLVDPDVQTGYDRPASLAFDRYEAVTGA